MKDILNSWGLYPNCPQTGHFVGSTSDIERLISRFGAIGQTTLAYGNGRSYGDSCLASSREVLHTKGLDRFIEADWDTGIIKVEAGVTLGEILAVSVRKGWFLQVTPGTKYVTVGGAIANDVHGKNHHVRGTFGNYTLQLGLFRSDVGLLTCSRDRNADYFCATIGGLGLSGVIIWAEIQLMRVANNLIDTITYRFDSIADFFSLSQEFDSSHEYSVAWVDCVASGKSLGRGVYSLADHAKFGQSAEDERSRFSVPITPPFSLINKYTLKAFNEAYWRKAPSFQSVNRAYYDPFFYPLDRISNWNRIYGKGGFQQYQCVIPEDHAEIVIPEILRRIAVSDQGSFLAVLKKCGHSASPGYMSFPMRGTSLALDFSNSAQVKSLFSVLDAIVVESGGRLYPAKDAHMRGEDFKLFYPQWSKVADYRDPCIQSAFWKRVVSE
jgi:FAD/FMN-containing dehydrogenase